ncbi:DUF3857 domain-containing transglutaminase family protein [Maricaulis sp.]|uniref:DUF3857 domain-containing transglutaminase family protein n=1 Tax=Maricaulis sp. TaxID=1486257 RepID=UPI002B27A66B|nr:DUF3857 domain-containing transglutaminase family protein [Maricaulis sp.]
MLRCVLLGCVLASVSPAAALTQSDLPTIAAPVPAEAEFGAPPAFVEEVTPLDPDNAIFDSFGGVRYLLIDDQHDARGEEPALYIRRVREASNASAIETLASFEVNFDPSYEHVVFHHIRLTRDGEVLDRQDRAQIEFARHESNRDRQMLNGEVTALARIDDVRVGDIVDYAYTVYGLNPTYNGRDFRRFGLNWGVPVERRSIRSLWPRGEARFIDVSPGEADIERVRRRNHEEFRLDPAPREAINPERGTPNRISQFPALRISSFSDWSDVAAWGTPLFTLDPSAPVQTLAAEIAAAHDTPEARLMAALNFVQNDVRYLALTYGEGSYVPAAPSDTLETRYGDCKAKTALLVELARALEFDADPALVNLGAGRGIDQREPSPGAFNHVIVRLRHDGRTFWLDPTRSYQGGTLDVVDQADYGFALPLDGAHEGLVSMANTVPQSDATVTIHETLDLSGGRDVPAILTVETVLSGRDADRYRARIARDGLSGLQRDYLDFYNQTFGAADFIEPIDVNDDVTANRLTVREQVELIAPFEDGEQPEAYSIRFRAHGISSLIESNAERRRETPLNVYHPTHARHVVDLVLTNGGEGWTLQDEQTEIDNAAFRYAYSSTHMGPVYRMEFELRSLAHDVPPDAALEVLRDHRTMLNSAYYGFDLIDSAE